MVARGGRIELSLYDFGANVQRTKSLACRRSFRFGFRFRLRFRFGFGLSKAAFLEPHDHDIKDRGEEEAEECDSQHSEEHRSSQGLAHFVASATADYQGQHAEDEGERRHENRPETKLRGLD